MGISSWFVPTIIFLIIACGVFKRIAIFDSFILGAKNGLETIFAISPSLIGLIVAVGMLKRSGTFDIFSDLIKTILPLKFPPQLVPLAILRPISGSASLAVFDNLISTYGPDSYIGRTAALIMGSTETTIYTIAIYFGSVNIKKTRHALVSSILSDFVALIVSVICSNFFWC